MDDYHTSFTVSAPPEEAFKKILDPSAWWSKHFDGQCAKQGDVFTVRFGPNGEKDMYKLQVIEAISPKRIVWKVIDSKQDWVAETNEWTGSEIMWDIAPENSGSKITLTHHGLTEALECYKTCEGGWNWLIGESLRKLLEENMGKPV